MADRRPQAGLRGARAGLYGNHGYEANYEIVYVDADGEQLDRRPHTRPRVGADGSLTIYLQHESPGPGKEPNWLPTPAGDFRPIMRTYQPKPEVLDRDYVLPAIRNVG